MRKKQGKWKRSVFWHLSERNSGSQSKCFNNFFINTNKEWVVILGGMRKPITAGCRDLWNGASELPAQTHCRSSDHISCSLVQHFYEKHPTVGDTNRMWCRLPPTIYSALIILMPRGLFDTVSVCTFPSVACLHPVSDEPVLSIWTPVSGIRVCRVT